MSVLFDCLFGQKRSQLETSLDIWQKMCCVEPHIASFHDFRGKSKAVNLCLIVCVWFNCMKVPKKKESHLCKQLTAVNTHTVLSCLFLSRSPLTNYVYRLQRCYGSAIIIQYCIMYAHKKTMGPQVQVSI